MKILIAQDDTASRLMLNRFLTKWGHEVVAAENGGDALEVLMGEDAPLMAIVDWMMPVMDGLEICKRVRAGESTKHIYLIILTSMVGKSALVQGLESGANDYVTKPFNGEELKARLGVGVMVVGLHNELRGKVEELEKSAAQVRQLEAILPTCSYCKLIRDKNNNWQTIQEIINETTDTKFSHGICPDCHEREVKPQMEKRRQQREQQQQRDQKS